MITWCARHQQQQQQQEQEEEDDSREEWLDHHEELGAGDDGHRVQLDAAQEVSVDAVTVQCLTNLQTDRQTDIQIHIQTHTHSLTQADIQGQLSLASLWGRLIEYQLRLG